MKRRRVNEEEESEETSSIKVVDVATERRRKRQICGVLLDLPVDCVADGHAAELLKTSRALAVLADAFLYLGVPSSLLKFFVQAGTDALYAAGKVPLTERVPKHVQYFERCVVVVAGVDVEAAGKIVA